jgi:hypothetical protein
VTVYFCWWSVVNDKKIVPLRIKPFESKIFGLMNQSPHHASTTAIVAIVVVAALGYFVDIYDLILFSVVRIKSLKDLGVTDVTNVGMSLISWQMWGMLIGGLLWGIWGGQHLVNGIHEGLGYLHAFGIRIALARIDDLEEPELLHVAVLREHDAEDRGIEAPGAG